MMNQGETVAIWTSKKIDKTKAKSTARNLRVAMLKTRTHKQSGCGSETSKQYQLTTGCSANNINEVDLMKEHRSRYDEDVKYDLVGEDQQFLALLSANEEGVGEIGFLFYKKISNNARIDKINDQIMIAIIENNPRIRIICTYPPTESTEDEVKNDFCTEHEAQLESITPHYLVILSVNFNARICQVTHTINSRMVDHSTYHAITNKNGQNQLDTCISFKPLCNTQGLYTGTTGYGHVLSHLREHILNLNRSSYETINNLLRIL